MKIVSRKLDMSLKWRELVDFEAREQCNYTCVLTRKSVCKRQICSRNLGW